MITGHAFIATSLDGFIARQDGDIAWLENVPTVGENHGFEPFMDTVDGLVMGRHTYEKVLAFDNWPYQKTVVVLSKSLRQDRCQQDFPKVSTSMPIRPKYSWRACLGAVGNASTLMAAK